MASKKHAVPHLSFIQPCRLPCTSTPLILWEVRSGSKSSKILMHKYKVIRFLSSLRQLAERFDECQNWCRSWPSAGHLLVTMSWEISIATTWPPAMIFHGHGQMSAVGDPQPAKWLLGKTHQAALLRQTLSKQQTFAKSDKDKEYSGTSPPPFPNRALIHFGPQPHCSCTKQSQTQGMLLQNKHTHSNCLSLVSLCYSLLQAFLLWFYTIDIKTIECCWMSLAYAVPDVWRSWRMLPRGAPSLRALAGCCS